MTIVELPVECHPEGTEEAERLGLDAPDYIAMRSRIVVDQIVGWNETEGDEETILSLANGDSIGVHLSFEETTRRIEAASGKTVAHA